MHLISYATAGRHLKFAPDIQITHFINNVKNTPTRSIFKPYLYSIEVGKGYRLHNY